MEIESKNFTPQFDEEHEEHFTMQRVSSIVWIKRLAVISFLLSLAQIVLNIIHFLTYHMHLVVILLISGFAFLIGTILIFHWARQAQRAYVQSRELFQPRVNDRLTRSIFVMGLLFAAEAVILLVNILMQRDYSNDYIRAQDTNDAIWDSKYQGRTPESLTGFYNLSFLLQAGFMGFFFIYFILTGRTAFKCLKWDNQGMSHFVFVASVILLGAGLGLIYYCRFAAGFDSYPHIRENLPKWNVTLLLVLGIFAAVVAIIGFVVDHRGWRVGFLLLGALCLVLIVSLSAFTGLAYKGADKTYDYYEGVNNTNTCSDRLYHVHKVHIEKYGCPQKYVPTDQCDQTQWVTRWEPIQATEVEEESDETDSGEAEKKEAGAAPERSSDTEESEESEEEETQTPPPAETEGETQTESTTPETEDEGQTSTTEGQTAPETETEASTSQNNANTGNQDVNESSGNTQTSTVSDGSTTQTTTTTTGEDGSQTTTTIVTTTSTNETTGLLMFAQQNYYDPNYYCLNTKCCGLLGQMYSRHMLNMANMGLLTILISCLITMACYYFWYVKYVDSARDKKKDFVWVGLMVLVVVAFVLATIFTKRPYFAEKLDANGQRTFVF